MAMIADKHVQDHAIGKPLSAPSTIAWPVSTLIIIVTIVTALAIAISLAILTFSLLETHISSGLAALLQQPFGPAFAHIMHPMPNCPAGGGPCP